MKNPPTLTGPQSSLLPNQAAPEPANLNQPPSQKQTSSGFDAVANLENFVIPEIDDDHEDIDAPVDLATHAEMMEAAAPPPDTMDKEAFWIVFKTVFSIPSFIIPDLKGLAIQPAEEYGARGASDATHSLLEIYYPNALMPQGEVFGHLMIAGPFFIGKAMIVREMLRARNAKPANMNHAPRSEQKPGQGQDKPEPPKAENKDWPESMNAIEIPVEAAA